MVDRLTPEVAGTEGEAATLACPLPPEIARRLVLRLLRDRFAAPPDGPSLDRAMKAVSRGEIATSPAYRCIDRATAGYFAARRRDDRSDRLCSIAINPRWPTLTGQKWIGRRMNNDDKEPQGNSNAWMKNMLVVVAIIGALFLFLSLFDGGVRDGRAGDTIPYSDFLAKVDDGGVKDVVISDNVISGKLGNDQSFHTYSPGDPQLVQRLQEKGVSFRAKPEEQTSVWLLLLYQALPFLLILGIAFFVMRQMQKNAGSGAMGFGKSRAKLLTEKHGKVTFDDVAGIDEAREELQEIVEFLKDPTKFRPPRRQDPQGRAAGRLARHRQDAARPRDRGRGGRAVLHHLGLGLRRDVRRRRREPRARHVRAGQEERALHRLHRRDRRGRPPSRRGPGQRQ